ncbi:MAG: NAD-dependent epimerase/dehydratase family protein [Acidimicrobiales bacterium]
MVDGRAVVLGAGPVGRALVDRLHASGSQIRVVTRSGHADVPDDVEVVAADVSKSDDAVAACRNADIVYSCVGMNYQGWPELWPPMMAGMLDGAAAAQARFVFMDNCYMYGPVSVPMTEDLPLTTYGRKPATRAKITRLWQDAHGAGRVESASVRASDFYGPGVLNAALGERSIGRLAEGKPAQIVGDPDQLHSFAYVPDIARALETVGAADDAMGEAWNVPNAPEKTMREILQALAAELGQPLKVQSMPKPLMSILSFVNADVRELKEMMYQWERPFIVDSTKFETRFWHDPTPWAEGIKATAAAWS